MAVIKCPECGGMVSEHAEKCIHCGYPLAQQKQQGVIKIKVEVAGAGTRLALYNTEGEKLAMLHEGTLTTINIDREMSVYVKRVVYKDSPCVKVYPHKVNRLQVGYSGIMRTQLTLNAVDVIDSDY